MPTIKNNNKKVFLVSHLEEICNQIHKSSSLDAYKYDEVRKGIQSLTPHLAGFAIAKSEKLTIALFFKMAKMGGKTKACDN